MSLNAKAHDLIGSAMPTLAKLLSIVALVLTSFAMTAAAAAAPHHGPAPVMAMEHCPDMGGTTDTKSGVPECAMACSSALPATDLPQSDPLAIVCQRAQGRLAQALHGLHPDTATPPPKRS